MSPTDPRHGTNAGYNAHVKEREDACYPCRIAAAQHAADVRRQQAYGRWNPWTDPAPVRAHVQQLLDGGMPLRAVAEAAGVRANRISNLIYGRNGRLAERIRPEFAAAVLAVEPVASRISGRGAARRVQALITMGYSTGLLAEHLGVERARVHQIVRGYKPLIMRETHDRITALYDALCMVPPPRETPADRQRASRARTTARQNGYASPLAWDDIDNDPAPQGVARRKDQQRRRNELDEVLIERVLSGEWSRGHNCTVAERREVCRRWVERGGSLVSLQRLTGWNPHRYYKAATPLGMSAGSDEARRAARKVA